MDIKSFITQAERVFNCAGDPCDYGCHESAESKMIEYVKEHLPGYTYCVIADWVWIDINISPEGLKRFDELGAKPCVVYAHEIVNDEAGRSFEFLRTSFLQDFQQNCIFLSRNTAYILSGSGTRTSIDSLVFAAVFR